MKTLIVANWKCNPASLKEAKTLFGAIKTKAKSKNADIIICPPLVYLGLLKGVTLGAQNMGFEQKGAFTGEISPLMLKDLRVEYVIIGHSERRNYFGETDEIINKKIKKALESGLKVIFCVGEKAGEDKLAVLEKQLIDGLKNIQRDGMKHIVIAYEPVWAIGTGKNCSVDETISSVMLIRKIVSNLYNRQIADSVKILYGGSVNSSNSAEYLKNAGVQGLLVGGASLNAEEFTTIVKSAE